MVKGKHILVVDDIAANRLILIKILSTMGAECDAACDGQEALDKFMGAPPDTYDLIFMDIQMPVMNGYEASKAIRASGRADLEKIPIVAMTADAFADDIRKSEEAGMNDHISKPVDIERLEEALLKWIN